MALNLSNLDEKTRPLMVSEIDLDERGGQLYISPRLNEDGRRDYPALLREAAQFHDDGWLAGEIRQRNLLRAKETRRTPSGGTTEARVPETAPETLAEGEFNRFYCRAVCARALEEGKINVRVCRAKLPVHPRPESVAKERTLIDARQLLNDLRRSQGVEPALGIPPGPNSGLSVELP